MKAKKNKQKSNEQIKKPQKFRPKAKTHTTKYKKINKKWRRKHKETQR